MIRSGRYEARHSRKARGPRSRGHRVLVGVNVLVAVALVLSGTAFGYAEWRLHQIHHVRIHSLTAVGHDKQSVRGTVGRTSAGPPETILLVGSDSRAALAGTASAQQYGSAAQVGGARSDTIILVRLVPATKQIELLSIPRDLYVPIAGLGHQKINAALGVSPDLLIRTIEAQFGVDVNHYVDIDFQSFKDISVALGGVSIYFPTPVRDAEETNFQIPTAGCVPLVGDEALAFVRSRMYQYYLDGYWHQEAESDLARIQRQQFFIRKMVGKAERTGLGNPLTLNAILGGVTKNLTVDDSFSVRSMISLAQTFRSVNPASIQGLTLPSYGVVLPGPDDVLMPEPTADKAMIQQFLSLGEATTPAPTTPAPSTTTTPGSTSGTSQTSGTSSTSGTSQTSGTTASVVTPTTALATSSIAVEVYNGSGVTGQATSAAAALRSAGYRVVGTNTASSYDHPSSIIEYGYGEYGAAAQLQASVGGGATLQETGGLGSVLELITGSSFAGVTAPGTGATAGGAIPATTATTGPAVTSTAVPATTTTTIPATTTTTYALPGTPPTGAPTCN